MSEQQAEWRIADEAILGEVQARTEKLVSGGRHDGHESHVGRSAWQVPTLAEMEAMTQCPDH